MINPQSPQQYTIAYPPPRGPKPDLVIQMTPREFGNAVTFAVIRGVLLSAFVIGSVGFVLSVLAAGY